MAENYNTSKANFIWYNYKDFHDIEVKLYNKSNNNVNINELEAELKDINGLEDEPSIEYNEIKDNNINNDNQENDDNLSSENECSISDDLNESISDDNDKGYNLDEKSLITKYDKIFSDESSCCGDFEDAVDFEFSNEFSIINDI